MACNPVLILVAFLYFGNATNIFSAAYHAEGTSEESYYRQNGSLLEERHFAFAVDYNQDQWLIRLWRTEHTNAYVECGYDGKSFKSFMPFTRTRMFIDPATLEPIPPPNTLPQSGSATITRRTIPRPLGHRMISVIWFGLAGHKFRQEIRDKMEPLFYTASMGADHDELGRFKPQLPVHVERADGYIKKLVLLSEGKILGWKQPKASWTTEPALQHYPPPFNKGFTNGVYEVIETGKIKEQHVPTSYQYSQLAPRPTGSTSADTYLRGLFKVKATLLAPSPHAITNFEPHIPNTAQVNDRRFELDKKPVFSFTYTVTNRWLTDEETRQLPQYARQLEVQTALIEENKLAIPVPETQQSPTNRGYLLILFAILSLALVIWFTTTTAKRSEA